MGKRTPALSRRLQGLINWPSSVRHSFLSEYIKHVFQDHIIGEPGIRASTTGIWINVTVMSQVFHPVRGSAEKMLKVGGEAKEETVEASQEEAENAEESNDTDLAPKKTAEELLDAEPVEKKTAERRYSLQDHPLVRNPSLSFANVALSDALGPIETRVKALMHGASVDGGKTRNGHVFFKPLSIGSATSILEAKDCDKDTLKALQIYSDKRIDLRINCISNPLLDAGVLAEWVARSLKENDRALPKIYKQLVASVGGKM